MNAQQYRNKQDKIQRAKNDIVDFVVEYMKQLEQYGIEEIETGVRELIPLEKEMIRLVKRLRLAKRDGGFGF